MDRMLCRCRRSLLLLRLRDGRLQRHLMTMSRLLHTQASARLIRTPKELGWSSHLKMLSLRTPPWMTWVMCGPNIAAICTKPCKRVVIREAKPTLFRVKTSSCSSTSLISNCNYRWCMRKCTSMKRNWLMNLLRTNLTLSRCATQRIKTDSQSL